MPVLDLTAGWWNSSEWAVFETSWDRVWIAEVASGALALINWSGAILDLSPFTKWFYWSHKTHILTEAVMLYMTYDAQGTYDAPGKSSVYSYFAHFVALVLSGFSYSDIDLEFSQGSAAEKARAAALANWKPPTDEEIKAHTICVGCAAGYEEYCDEVDPETLYMPQTDEETHFRQYLCHH